MLKGDPRFLKGLELFNKGEFFESHEVIEDLWLDSRDHYRDLYKGVIQATAALYQFERGILTGAKGLYQTSMSYLECYRPEALGLNVEKLVCDMKSCFAELEHWNGEEKVSLEPSLIPQLDFTKRL